MKKFILQLDLHDGKDKRKALKTVSALSGIDAISISMKEKKLLIIGTVDPVSVVSKLRKFWPTELLLLGPAKEPEKKEEPKKEEPKKEEPKKEEQPKEEPKKEEAKTEEAQKEEPKKEGEKKPEPEAVVGTIVPYYPPMNTYNYRPYYPPTNTYNYRPYYPQSMEENPNDCVIS